jgi:phage-related protein
MPRVFEVPLVFEEIHDGTLRELAYWLDSPTPSKFQWVGDDVFINACLDSNDFNAASSSGFDGQIVLKFICYDPFYYDTNQTQYTVTTLTSGTTYTYNNAGYGDLEPHIRIACNGKVKIEVLDANGNVYTTTNITDITGGVTIDSETMECTLLSGASHFHKIDYFPYFPHGQFGIRVTGDALTNMSITYTQKYI